MPRQQYEITIDGRKYTIFSDKSDIDPLYISALESRLEEKVANLKKLTRVVDTSSLMVLLAVDTLDELEEMKNKLAKKDQHLKHKIQNIIQICDEVIA